MLWQRCRSLLQATHPTVMPRLASKQALSRHPLLRQQAAFSSRPIAAAASIQRLPSHHRLRPTPPAPLSQLHTSAQSLGPAASTAEPPQEPQGALEKPDFLDAAESEIWERLVKEFNPAELLVQDISGGCGSMYGIEISSDKFRGATMLKQQRMVNAVLGDLMKGWHGVQLKTRIP